MGISSSDKLDFAFVSNAAEREYCSFPEEILDEFGASLGCIQRNEKPYLAVAQLTLGKTKVMELKINGSPAYRCVYTVKFQNTVYVLHTFAKTTNGTDKQAMIVVEQRLKLLEQSIAVS